MLVKDEWDGRYHLRCDRCKRNLASHKAREGASWLGVFSGWMHITLGLSGDDPLGDDYCPACSVWAEHQLFRLA